MDDLSKARLSHLAHAMKDGAMVHPVLSTGLADSRRYWVNPDFLALTAAAHARGWQVTSARSEIGGKTMVEIDTKQDYVDMFNVHAKTPEAALVAAMHEATVGESDNLVECSCRSLMNPLSHLVTGQECHGTGYVVK